MDPWIAAVKIHSELGERVHGLCAGAIGAMLLRAGSIGLIADLHFLKRQLADRVSKHVLQSEIGILFRVAAKPHAR
jgi:hypothetical protein